MKTLVIMRHAEAEPEGSKRDFERMLTNKGAMQACKAAQAMVGAGIRPDIILHSAAERTTETAGLLVQAGSFSPKLLVPNHEMYNISLGAVLKIIEGFADNVEVAVLVGHNPTVSYLAEHLSSDPLWNLGTGNFACLSFNVASWAHVTKGTGSVRLAFSG